MVKRTDDLPAPAAPGVAPPNLAPAPPPAGRRGPIDLSRHFTLMVAGDVAIAAAAYLLAFWLRALLPNPVTQALIPSERFFQVKHYWWLLLGSQPVLLFFLDTYHDIRVKRTRELAAAAGTAGLLQVLGLIAAYFFTANLTYPRSIFPLFWFLNTCGVAAWRQAIKRSAARHKRRAVIVGSGPLVAQLLGEIGRAPEIGLEVVGIASDQLAPGERVGSCPVLGSRDAIVDILDRHRIDQVILTPEEASWKDRLVDAVSRLEGLDARISIVPSIYELLIGRIQHFSVRDIPLIEVAENPHDPVAGFARRLRDLAFGAALVVFFLPLWVVVAIAIKLSDGGRVVYSQTRVGQWGRPIRVHKFRTMPEGAEDRTGPVLARPDDPRLGKLGRFLRSYRIDESLQVVNVLMGEMSLVGPRPDRPEFVARFAAELPGYLERHKVKPGITGLAQVRGHYHSDPAIKLKYDLAYIYNRSFLLDLFILLETVRIVVRREGV
jgi:exopolysaccharide biosynthesis polyprenyl glycosylphosphotransferase